MTETEKREINEAIGAADYALSCLRRAQGHLSSARGWGIFDMLGGGLITTLIKHSKMNDAERDMQEAQRAMQAFSRELSDVDATLHTGFNNADFLSFADYFFDGFLADVLVQSRIANARQQVDDAICRVSDIRNRLVGMLNA